MVTSVLIEGVAINVAPATPKAIPMASVLVTRSSASKRPEKTAASTGSRLMTTLATALVTYCWPMNKSAW
jgi:hypothetical protein